MGGLCEPQGVGGKVGSHGRGWAGGNLWARGCRIISELLNHSKTIQDFQNGGDLDGGDLD